MADKDLHWIRGRDIISAAAAAGSLFPRSLGICRVSVQVPRLGITLEL